MAALFLPMAVGTLTQGPVGPNLYGSGARDIALEFRSE